MKVKRIQLPTQLPPLMALYHAPYFAVQQQPGESDEKFAIRDSAYLFRRKWGEPGMVYLHEANVFIELMEE